MNAEGKKHCRKCGVELVAGENWYNSLVGKYNICKACHYSCASEWGRSNIDRAKAKQAAWYVANRDRARNAGRAWYQANKGRQRELGAKWRAANPAAAACIRARLRAKNAGIPFSIRASDVDENRLCPALGIEMAWGAGSGVRSAPEHCSLDKVVPGAGYTPGNVCVISHRANTLKGDATPEESLAVALYSYTYTGHSASDIHAAVDAILAKQAEYRRINEAARNIDNAQHCCP